MFELSVEGHFSAAHQVKGYIGDCADIHGHTYKVKVTVGAGRLDKIGMAVDFRSVKKQLDELLKELDHKNLNSIPFFEERNATAEYIAKYLFDRIKENISSIVAVTVWEGPNYSVTYSPDEV
ncbi:MAG: 6-carboxytetrahydropterin synthase QueD [candidate division WOR-3 bacterium]|nr:MAG: 6-carboxytetrahydropterin synthase QueD [candidate division WOR-3 bacterium]